jgi:hypothetical protein
MVILSYNNNDCANKIDLTLNFRYNDYANKIDLTPNFDPEFLTDLTPNF